MRVRIVSGPTSAGKSTLIRRLRSGAVCLDAVPEIRNAVRVRGHSLRSERNIERVIGTGGNLIVHYDFLRPYRCVFVTGRAGSNRHEPPICLEEVLATPPNYADDIAFTLVRRADEGAALRSSPIS